MIDYATRFPEAVPSPGIETERVAEGLVHMFSKQAVIVAAINDNAVPFDV